ncbi:MAG: MBL fold metallo-hydrolase [Proteobacteria bacterium]|nr:MBL fold metallo-hydrolase [Pseudomonadota bacterium]MBS0572928.1 MBL fold metallo-hydrolase [Pseudomonadota bacterium]
MTEAAPPYGVCELLGPGLCRILAPNPSAMTGQGTNTYLVGEGGLALIDPGPDDPRHLAAILAATGAGRRISHIFVTHAHRDHSGLAPALARATGAPVLAFGDAGAGRSALMRDLAAREGARGTEGTDEGFRPQLCLADGESVEGEGWRLTALHTPGHFGNHLCLRWGGQIFSGDHVMGWSTSVVAPPDGDMGAYMRSLARLGAAAAERLLPGHGAPVGNPAARIGELIAHRQSRARAIAVELARGPDDAASLAARIYRDTPAALMGAAALNVFAHLVEMTEENIAMPEGGIHLGTRFRLK